MVRTLGELENDDAWDVLCAAQLICEGVRKPFSKAGGGKGAAPSPVSDRDAEYLSKKALRQIEEAQKRELTARERSGMMEAIASAESLLRDVLVRCEGAGQLVNADVSHVVGRLASSLDSTQVLRALDACSQAADDLAHNVSPQLTLEVWLLNIKEAYACPA
jgi:DNA polymerase-3 subunit delta'